MGRKKNDGRGRLGGRSAGTPNKINSTIKEWIQQLIDDNRDQVADDIKQLKPYQRVALIERLIGYVLPRQAAADEETRVKEEYAALEQLLKNAPDKAIDAIVERVQKIRQQYDEG